MRIKETETRIEQEVAGLRERVEAVKFSTLQWLMYVPPFLTFSAESYRMLTGPKQGRLHRYRGSDYWCLASVHVRNERYAKYISAEMRVFNYSFPSVGFERVLWKLLMSSPYLLFPLSVRFLKGIHLSVS